MEGHEQGRVLSISLDVEILDVYIRDARLYAIVLSSTTVQVQARHVRSLDVQRPNKNAQ